MLLKRFNLNGRTWHWSRLRRFSGDAPSYVLHESVKDIEELFAKYALDRESDPMKITQLEHEGIIPPSMAENLRDRIKKSEEAASNHLYLI